MKFTLKQIVNVLKERGWVKEGSLWFFPTNRYGGIAMHYGVSLRDAASFEALEANENLDPRRRRK